MEEEIKRLRSILASIADRASDEQNHDYDDLIDNLNKIQELTQEFKD